LLNKRPKKFNKDTIIIATEAGKSDAKDRAMFREMGFKVYDTEYLLTGLLTHKFPKGHEIKS
jgi:hypothetical protein